MKIIIFGANETGAKIASEFYVSNDITVIDNEKNKVDTFNKLDISFVDGNATNAEVLKNANIKSSDIFIACTDSDELNIVACMTAKKFSNINTMCFVRKEAYKSSLGFTKEADYNCDFYIDNIIWPEELLTQEIYRIITVEKALDVENFANGKARLLEYKISENSILVDKQVKHCNFPKDTLIVGIKREEDFFIPNGESVLKQNDKVIFMGLSESLNILAGKFFHEKKFVKNVTIIGGGHVGRMLAKNLDSLNLNLKIIEKDESRCEILSEQLNNALIINGDGTDLELLNEEDVGESDVLVCVTNNDEKNLLCSLMAKQLGAKKVITRVQSTSNATLFEKVGIDVAISSRTASINEIKNSISGTNLGILATVEQGKAEVIEIILPASFKPVKVMDLKLPVKAVIGIIQRRNRVIIPNGTTQIYGEDTLILLTKSEDIVAAKKYFKVEE